MRGWRDGPIFWVVLKERNMEISWPRVKSMREKNAATFEW